MNIQPLRMGSDFSLSPIIPQTFQFGHKVKRLACVSDVHIPFHNRMAWEAMWKVLADAKPDLIVWAGDINDNYLLSDYSTDPDRGATLQTELDMVNTELVRPASELCPHNVWIMGNHEVRTYKQLATLRGMTDLRAHRLSALAGLPSGWAVLQNQSDLLVGDVTYGHGDFKGRGGNAKNLAAAILAKVGITMVTGHNHRFDVCHYTNARGVTTTSYTNGHMSDVAQARYIYGPNWQTGFTLVDYSKSGRGQIYQLLWDGECFLWAGKEYNGNPSTRRGVR